MLDTHNLVVWEWGQIMVKIMINVMSCGDLQHDYFFNDAKQRWFFAKVWFAPA